MHDDVEFCDYWTMTYGPDQVREIARSAETLLRAVAALQGRKRLWGSPFDDDKDFVLHYYKQSILDITNKCARLGMGFGPDWVGAWITPSPEWLDFEKRVNLTSPGTMTVSALKDLQRVLYELGVSEEIGGPPTPIKLTFPSRLTSDRLGDVVSRLKYIVALMGDSERSSAPQSASISQTAEVHQPADNPQPVTLTKFRKKLVQAVERLGDGPCVGKEIAREAKVRNNSRLYRELSSLANDLHLLESSQKGYRRTQVPYQ
jgi:hypothetical protein